MTPTLLRLIDDTRELVVWDLSAVRDDLIVDELDVSSPTAREVVEDRSDGDGTDDDTAFHGAAAVSLKLVLAEQPQTLLALFKPFLRFGRRPWLCLTEDEWGEERRIRLRADQWSKPQPYAGLGRHLKVQLQWKAPDGVWLSSEPTQIAVVAQGDSRTGISFPTGWPWTFEATGAIGQVLHTNLGSEPAHQRVRLYGPCRGPRWTCDTTGETVSFTEDLVIPAGDYVEVDTAARTAFYLSDPGAPRIGYLDYATSSWWRIPDGESRLRYHPISGVDAGCQALATYQRTHSA